LILFALSIAIKKQKEVTDLSIRQIFPELSDEEVIAFIREIKGILCPTCLENKDGMNYDESYSGGDCPHRHINPKDILSGNGSNETLDHWHGALEDAKGALKQIAKSYGEPYVDWHIKTIRGIFTTSCAQAQELMARGIDWKSIYETPEYVNANAQRRWAINIGISYKYGDPNDPTYAEMHRLGQE